MPERAGGHLQTGQGGVDRAALDRAHAAMMAGCDFLIARAAQPPGGAGVPPNVQLRRAGNCLNELDRFLSVLIAECARAAGIVETGVPAEDADAYPRRSDNARRLRRIDAHCGHASPATTRLRAIGRIRQMAGGTGGLRPGAWLERDIAVATDGRAAIVAHPDQAPEIGDVALAAIAEFYAGIGDRLYRYFGTV